MGLDDQLVEEVRLAVGEACARHLTTGAGTRRLRLELREDVPGRPGLHVVVRAVGAGGTLAPAATDDLSLAVLEGLVPELRVGAYRLDLHWPVVLSVRRCVRHRATCDLCRTCVRGHARSA